MSDRLCASCSAIFTNHVSPDGVSIRGAAVAADATCYICAQVRKSMSRFDRPDDPSLEPHSYSCDYHVSQLPRQDNHGFVLMMATGTPASGVVQYDEFYVFSEEKTRRLGIRTSLPSGTRSEETMQQAREWLRDCLHNHEDCRSSQRAIAPLPTRLVSVQREASCLIARLCESVSLPPNTDYLSLSHCWGNVKFTTLTTTNHQQFRDSIPIAELSRAFQDAFLVTVELGFQYIWIDSLCIIQDQKSDWRAESSKMASVYQNAVCNITASGFESGLNGFLREERQNDPTPISTDVAWDMPSYWDAYPGRYFVLHDSSPWEDVFSGPLFRRGWVLQEQVLAPRSLHFSARQVYWECSQALKSETWPYGWTGSRSVESEMPSRLFAFPFMQLSMSRMVAAEDNPYEVWRRIIESYTRRSLTFPTDRFPALEGMKSEFERAVRSLSVKTQGESTSMPYIQGLWGNDLAHELVWQNDDIRHRPIDLGHPISAPSWSWASSGLPVSWEKKSSMFTPVWTELLRRYHVSSDGVLHLTGPLMRFRPPACRMQRFADSILTTQHFVLHLPTADAWVDIFVDPWYWKQVFDVDEEGLCPTSPAPNEAFLETALFLPLLNVREWPASQDDKTEYGIVLAPWLRAGARERGLFNRVGLVKVTLRNLPRGEDGHFGQHQFEGERPMYQGSIAEDDYIDCDGLGNYTIAVV